MRLGRFWHLMYWLLDAWQWIAGVVLAMMAGALKADPGWYGGIWTPAGDAIRWLQNLSPLVLPLLIVSVGFANVFQRVLGPPWVWTAVQRVLDEFRNVAFSDRTGPVHCHRVTLFKAVRLRRLWKRWPWSRCLVPFARSGHTTQRTNVMFRIPDDADKAEGVAGRTWTENRIVQVDGLPELSGTSAEEQLDECARKTWVDAKWLRSWLRKEHVARSLYGIPVEVRNKLWGVIVLDSRDDKAIGKKARPTYNLVGKTLSILLERARI